MSPGLDFEGQRLVVANDRLFGHECVKLAGNGNGRCHRLYLRDQQAGLAGHGGGGRFFVELGIPLGRHLVEKRCSEPSREDDGRTTDKTAGIHRLLRKRLLLPGQVLLSFRRNSNLKDPCRGMQIFQKGIVASHRRG